MQCARSPRRGGRLGGAGSDATIDRLGSGWLWRAGFEIQIF